LPDPAALIALLMLERPLCLDCIADQAKLSTEDTKRSFQTIGQTVEIHAGEDRCGSCGRFRMLFSLRRLER
jgi:hypothetical protein